MITLTALDTSSTGLPCQDKMVKNFSLNHNYSVYTTRIDKVTPLNITYVVLVSSNSYTLASTLVR